MDLYGIYLEMRSKYGWTDGKFEPSNIEEFGEHLVELINVNLPETCEVEAYRWDRPGLHNHCLISYRRKGTYARDDMAEPNEVKDILNRAYEDEWMTPEFNIDFDPGPLEESEYILKD